jgi:ATP-dependent Clp protease ATP-binding subunit ClpA
MRFAVSHRVSGDGTEGHVYLDDLDCLAGRLTAATQRVVDRALEESRRREHALLTTAHMWFAVANTEWDLFASTLRGVEMNPRDVLRAIEEHLRLVPSQAGTKLRVSPPMKLVCRLALHHAARSGRSTVEAGDMLLALFDGPQGVPVAILRRFGVEPDVLTSRLEAHFRERELRQERLKKRFDLPPHVDQFTTNLNRLACLDKLPPVFGRDREIRQVLVSEAIPSCWSASRASERPQLPKVSHAASNSSPRPYPCGFVTLRFSVSR